jgi:hypothetical protein
MKQINNPVSKHKTKRQKKNKKRMMDNPYHNMSRAEREENMMRQKIISDALKAMDSNQ